MHGRPQRLRGDHAGRIGVPSRVASALLATIPAVPVLDGLGASGLRDVMTTFRDVVRAHQEGINRLNVYPVPEIGRAHV